MEKATKFLKTDMRIIAHFSHSSDCTDTLSGSEEEKKRRFESRQVVDAIAKVLLSTVRGRLEKIAANGRKRRRQWLEKQFEGELGQNFDKSHDGDNNNKSPTAQTSSSRVADQKIAVWSEKVNDDELFVDLTEAAFFAMNSWGFDEELLSGFFREAIVAGQDESVVSAVASANNSTTLLVAREQQWWDRPLWSWTKRELLLAFGAMLASEMRSQSATILTGNNNNKHSLQVCVSSNKLISRLLYLHAHHCATVHLPNIALIDEFADAHTIQTLLDPIPLSALSKNGIPFGKIQTLFGFHTVSDVRLLPRCSLVSVLNSKTTADSLYWLARGQCKDGVVDMMTHNNNDNKPHLANKAFLSKKAFKSNRCLPITTISNNSDQTKSISQSERGRVSHGTRFISRYDGNVIHKREETSESNGTMVSFFGKDNDKTTTTMRRNITKTNNVSPSQMDGYYGVDRTTIVVPTTVLTKTAKQPIHAECKQQSCCGLSQMDVWLQKGSSSRKRPWQSMVGPMMDFDDEVLEELPNDLKQELLTARAKWNRSKATTHPSPDTTTTIRKFFTQAS